MQLSLPGSDLKRYVASQLALFFPDQYAFDGADVDSALALALERLEFCFRHVAFRGYNENGQVTFSHLHSDQYCQFIYLLSNSLWHISQNRPLCDKLTLLNRALHSVFLSYKVDLPNIFHFAHAVGSVLGHANYSDFLVVFQRVTVNTADAQVNIGKGVCLSAGATVMGSSNVGDRSSIGANTLLFSRDVPPDSVAFTDATGEVRVSPRSKECAAQQFFNVRID